MKIDIQYGNSPRNLEPAEKLEAIFSACLKLATFAGLTRYQARIAAGNATECFTGTDPLGLMELQKQDLPIALDEIGEELGIEIDEVNDLLVEKGLQVLHLTYNGDLTWSPTPEATGLFQWKDQHEADEQRFTWKAGVLDRLSSDD